MRNLVLPFVVLCVLAFSADAFAQCSERKCRSVRVKKVVADQSVRSAVCDVARLTRKIVVRPACNACDSVCDVRRGISRIVDRIEDRIECGRNECGRVVDGIIDRIDDCDGCDRIVDGIVDGIIVDGIIVRVDDCDRCDRRPQLRKRRCH